MDGSQPGFTSESSKKLLKSAKCAAQLHLEGEAQKSVLFASPQATLTCSQVHSLSESGCRRARHIYIVLYFTQFHQEEKFSEKGTAVVL